MHPFPCGRFNRNDTRSLVDQVADGLRQAIVGGRYRPGDDIPSSRELVSLFGVSRIVTKAALTRLADEEYVISRTGVKTVVRERGIRKWNGHVVFVYETDDDNYLKTMLASTMRDRLTDVGYLFTQASVGRTKDGEYDFAHLDMALSPSVYLVVVMYHPWDPETEGSTGDYVVHRGISSKTSPWTTLAVGSLKPNDWGYMTQAAM